MFEARVKQIQLVSARLVVENRSEKKRVRARVIMTFFSRLANKTRFEENIDVTVFIMVTVNFSTLIPNKSTP